jgi:hypothetical protein
VGSFVRRVKTASGATAVQIVHKRGRTVLGIEHIGSARDTAGLTVLLPQDILEAIDRFAADQNPPLPNRSEAIREILRDFLVGHGSLEMPPATEDTN